MAYVGPEMVVRTIESAEPGWLLLAFVSYALFFLLRGVRWKALLTDVAPRASLTDTTALSATGWLVSNFIPFKAGDLTRLTLLARKERARLSGVGGTVVIERALDLLGLALAASAGLLVAALYGASHLPPTVGRAIALAWILPIACLILVLLFVQLLPHWRAKNRIFRIAGDFLESANSLRRRPRLMAGTFFLTLLIIIAQVGVFVALFRAFDPTAPIPLLIGGAPLFLLSFIFAVAPGNAGVYEFSFAAVFTLMGFDYQTVLAMGVAVHLLTISMVTVLGGAGFVVHRILIVQPKVVPVPEPEAIP